MLTSAVLHEGVLASYLEVVILLVPEPLLGSLTQKLLILKHALVVLNPLHGTGGCFGGTHTS
jgi:hypothetical protein